MTPRPTAPAFSGGSCDARQQALQCVCGFLKQMSYRRFLHTTLERTSPLSPLDGQPSPHARKTPTPAPRGDVSTQAVFPTATPITVLLDATDDVAVTRAALAAHHPPAGRITVHPAPTTHHQPLAFDILAALGKPPELPGPQGRHGQTAWDTAAAWLLTLPATRLIVLRAHLLSAASLMRLLALRGRTGLHLVAVCHTQHPPTALRTVLRHVEHHTISCYDAAAGDLLTPAPQATPRRGRPLDNRAGPGLPRLPPELSRLPLHHPTPSHPPLRPRTHLRPRPDRPPSGHPHRLTPAGRRPRHRDLFTGAPLSRLHTVHYNHFDATAATLTLHDRYGTRRNGLATNCRIYTVPAWAYPFLLAAAHLLHLSPNGDGLLLPHTLPPLTGFAEHCRLRPPQPTAPQHPLAGRRTKKTAGSSRTQWYDGYLHPTLETVSYERWLCSAG